MSIPNLISLGRLLSVPLAVWLILVGELGWAFWLFLASGLSDAVDGWLARRAGGGWPDSQARPADLAAAFNVVRMSGTAASGDCRSSRASSSSVVHSAS